MYIHMYIYTCTYILAVLIIVILVMIIMIMINSNDNDNTSNDNNAKRRIFGDVSCCNRYSCAVVSGTSSGCLETYGQFSNKESIISEC